MIQTPPGFKLTPGKKTRGENDGIHRTRARAAYSIDGDCLILKQPIEDAPAEGAEGASALESEGEGFLLRPSTFPRSPSGSCPGAWSVIAALSTVEVSHIGPHKPAYPRAEASAS